ncbi:cis-zeatin O-glucosyltransferase 2-like [Dendrobium catenatum]|uniref:Glycosyltransferase n=1 Tax=Dendrobium catenatum TaxID=906689 RepID=A0A2I0W8L9_9ASPA|nr:cis-zeatin O-glucosyltransferase 2-like [Dendrobium catenatum]PKU72003.1 Cis-zeatin O-glucosyltransferase 2 [Dendrobium catenatum]
MSPAEIQPITILAVPFPAQSHLNQLLHFSLILSSRNLPVHFAAPSSSIQQAQLRLHGWPSTSLGNIHFHELALLPPAPLPPSSPPHLSHALRLFDTPFLLLPSLSSLLHSLSLSSRRLIVLHDTFMSVAALEAASLPNAESYTFQCVSAFQALFELQPNLRPTTRANPIVAAQFDDWVPKPILESVKRLEHERPVEAGIIANSCRVLDGEFVDLLAEEYGSKKVFAVSPLHLIGPRVAAVSEKRHDCLVWLDKQPVASVVYLSFGSTTTMAGVQVEQLAIGLRRSGQRFIWVIREADEGAIGSESDSRTGGLPAGFKEEMEGFGMIMKGWAPQVDILAHPSTAAFVSHCGWNSIMESLSYGVPIIAWPMQIDQPRNAMVLTEYLKSGVMVREWDHRKEVVPAAKVEEVVRMVVVEEEGKEMRERAKKIGEEIQKAVAEGGSSMADLNAFVAHITRQG